MKRIFILDLIFIAILIVFLVLSLTVDFFFFIPIIFFIPLSFRSIKKKSYNFKNNLPEFSSLKESENLKLRYCSRCGGEITKSIAKFCYHCGKELKNQ